MGLRLESVEERGEKERLGEARVAASAGSPGSEPAPLAARDLERRADRRVSFLVRVEQQA